ncbi:MAG: RagB/SusD family nutrient uptake outer membrane protein [Alistipes sp.]
MKNQFIKTYLLAFTTAVAALFASCSLEENPTSFVAPKDYYQTKIQCVSGLNACYIPAKNMYDYTFLIMTEGVTDLMYIASGTKDAQLDISPAKPLNGQSIWTQSYRAVMYCNSVIAGIGNSPLPEAQKLPLLAEGMTLRAYYYWLLTCVFGDVPFYTQEVSNDKLQEVAHLGRMPAAATRDYLIKELQEYVPHMDQIRSSEVQDNRVGAAMGWMMIAKLAQWNHRWEDARLALVKLEKIYGDLQQYPLEDVMFRNKNTPESIFEIQRTYTAGGLAVTTNVAAICTPSHNGKGIYDGVEIPEMGRSMTTWTSMRPNSYFYEALQTKKGADKRTAQNMAWSYNGKPFSKATSQPWLGPKFWCPKMQNTADFNNQKVFRYADVVLMMSECYAEQKNTDEAVRYLNMVKQRAGISLYTFKTPELLMEEIQKERGRELFGEFQRKFDLVRWGIWYQMTYDYTNYAQLKENILPCHEYYPIPDKEVVYSGGALDNKAYAAYGM